MISLGHRDGDQSHESLVDELVEAQLDTIELVVSRADEAAWLLHINYLQGLVRHAKRIVAQDAAARG